ncbi:MAG TPA: type I 3-dehydroquinate dehydratase [Pyrinomonadaceae bacterium]|nr:type I 3-dehydroquinate dehydratase [Pyrinomonadaceae bacterium]
MNNGKICVSVCAKTADELIEQIKRAEELADVIEIRFDGLETFNLENVSDRLLISKLQKFNKPFLATFRAFEEGGAKPITLDKDRIPFWENLNLDLSKFADFVDCEWELLSNVTHNWRFYKNIKNSEIVCSFHNFYSPINDFNNLANIFSQMSNLKLIGSTGHTNCYTERPPLSPNIFKIVVKTDEITDSIAIWKLLQFAKSENKPIIPIAMGESGKWTRILGLAHGAFMTYASLDSDKETAPGQVTARDLIEVYRAKELDETTDVYGILGSNTGVSLSPLIHNTAFKFHKLNSVFVPLQVHNLDEFIKRMVKPETREVDLNFKGFAVTIPHKQSIIKHLDYLDETAEKIGAVNTVKIIDGKLYGYNTDAQGFIEPLKQVYGSLENAKVAILGAGGSAKACGFALEKEKAIVTVFDGNQVRSSEFKTQNFSQFDIIVNTTPLGMRGKFEGETPLQAEQIKGVKLIYDLVYTPFQTQFMNEADKVDVPKISGMAMLIAQALEQQKIWTGLDAPMKEISAQVLKKL